MNKVLGDIADSRGLLPLLQVALEETWRVCNTGDRSPTDAELVHAYVKIGGVAGALATAADDVYKGLDRESQAIAQTVFLRLVKLSDFGEPIRRIAESSEFSPEQRKIAQRLATKDGRRLLVTSGDANRQRIELTHEALATQWHRYDEWLNADRQGKRVYDEVMTDTDKWSERQLPRDLLTGGRLEDAEHLVREHPDWLSKRESTFVRRSVAVRDARVNLQRRRLRILQILGLLLGGLLLFGGMTYRDAYQERRRNLVEAQELLDQAEEELRSGRKWNRVAIPLTKAEKIIGANSKQNDRHQRLTAEMQFASKLQQIRIDRANPTKYGLFDNVKALCHYTKAFRDFGIDIENDQIESVAKRIDSSNVRSIILEALDNLALIRSYRMRYDPGNKKDHCYQRNRILAIARLIDSGSELNRLRLPANLDDDSRLSDLANWAITADLSPDLAAMFGETLRLKKRDSEPLFRHYQRCYPDDFWINFNLARLCLRNLQQTPEPERSPEEALRFYQAALARHPQNTFVLQNMVLTLLKSGKVDDLVEARIYSNLALDIDAESAVALAYDALSYEKEDIELAIRKLRTVATENPEYRTARKNLERLVAKREKELGDSP